jgi:hypothetical protein
MENDRSVESFVAFAQSEPASFTVWQLADHERIPLIRRGDFFEYLRAKRDDFRPGDVVTVLGLRDDGKMHYHSFFVLLSDPVTGMPIHLAANAGRPRIRTWEGEMSNAPLRSIHTRIRPKLEWLESMTTIDDGAAAQHEHQADEAPI